MIEVSHVCTWGFEHAVRGMRNPMNSWGKSDSGWNWMVDNAQDIKFNIGSSDLDLMKRLYKSGHPHRKYLRQIMVSMDIVAPLYWWKEFDTYKVGVTENSCSTMHKIHAKEFTLDDFSHEYLFPQNSVHMTPDFYSMGDPIFSPYSTLTITIDCLNACRKKYLETKDKQWWWQLIQLLPSSYNQKRTITMNYENIMNILDYRDPHKLDEWNDFCAILKTLPYVEELRRP